MPADPTLPAVHLHHLVQVVARWKVTPGELLAGTGLDAAVLAAPGARVPLAQAIEVIERARRLTGEPALGFQLGLQMRVSWHGFIGFAALASPTARDAIEIAIRFAPTRTDALALRLHVEDRVASLVIEELAPLGSARDVVILALATGIWQIGNSLVGYVITGSVELAMPEPPYFARFAPFAPGSVRFDQPAHRLLFDAALLDTPLANADPVARDLARDQLERELAAVGGAADPVAQVRALLADNRAFPNIDEVARRMHVSARTLKRRLAERDTSFTSLLEEARRERALLLLRAGELSVDEVGRRVGYSDPANFARAFRRWTGKTPRAFRRE